MRPRGAAGGCRDGATYFFVSKYGGVAAGVNHSVGFFSGLRTYSPLANGRGKYLLTKESERALRKTYLAHLHELENEATGLHGAKCTNDGVRLYVSPCHCRTEKRDRIRFADIEQFTSAISAALLPLPGYLWFGQQQIRAMRQPTIRARPSLPQ